MMTKDIGILFESKDKKANPNILELVGLFIIIVFIFILISDIFLWNNSYKNIDTSWNMETLSRQVCENYQLVLNLSDSGSNFQSYSSGSYYIVAMNGIKSSFRNCLMDISVIMILLGILIGKKLIFKKEEKWSLKQ